VLAALAFVMRRSPLTAERLKKVIWRWVYEAASLRRSDGWTPLMNYGYAPLDGQPPGPPDLSYGLRLYAKVVGETDLTGKDVLEVGCGRGGGTAFVHEHFAPRSTMGLDLAHRAIEHCRRTYPLPGLRFVAGDAEELPFPDGAFDAVLNVESSHCYPDVPAFLAEVRRVLRPGGVLLLADARDTDSRGGQEHALLSQGTVSELRAQIAQAGFRVAEEEDVTANVMRALELDTPDRQARIERRVPKPLRPHVHALSAAKGSPIYQLYEDGKHTYLRFVLARD
jgi:SAM-dependent methyltransferase